MRRSGGSLTSAPIADQQANLTIDVVRNQLDDATAAELRSFWAQHAAMADDDAQRRLPEVVCVLRGAGGAIAGACSVFAGEVPLIDNRRFHILRTLLPGDASERFFDVLAAAWHALDAEYGGTAGEPVGVCALPGERERLARPQAEWQDPRTIYAGYLSDGRQVRLAYYSGAVSAGHRDWASERGFRIVPFAGQEDVTPDDVVALWTAEAGLSEAEARRRVDEVMLVAIDDEGRLAGVTTRYLRHNQQLRMDLWYQRAFTAHAHRKSAIGTALAVRGREHLEEAYVSGRDTRAAGLIYEVENEMLKQIFPNPVWKPADVLFIGATEQGAHVRVHYFAGAVAP